MIEWPYSKEEKVFTIAVDNETAVSYLFEKARTNDDIVRGVHTVRQLVMSQNSAHSLFISETHLTDL